MYLNITLAVKLGNITKVFFNYQWFQRIGFAAVLKSKAQSAARLSN